MKLGFVCLTGECCHTMSNSALCAFPSIVSALIFQKSSAILYDVFDSFIET